MTMVAFISGDGALVVKRKKPPGWVKTSRSPRELRFARCCTLFFGEGENPRSARYSETGAISTVQTGRLAELAEVAIRATAVNNKEYFVIIPPDAPDPEGTFQSSE